LRSILNYRETATVVLMVQKPGHTLDPPRFRRNGS
jgi:hypothetical protein